jgi:hypothetical protein
MLAQRREVTLARVGVDAAVGRLLHQLPLGFPKVVSHLGRR